MPTLKATLRIEPPSVNEMYARTAYGMTASTKTKKFKAKAIVELAKQWLFCQPLGRNDPHKLTLVFYLPEIENKGWPKSAKTRFKRKDVSNLVKILEDAIVTASGIDDSTTLELHVRKLADPQDPRVEIELSTIDELQGSPF